MRRLHRLHVAVAGVVLALASGAASAQFGGFTLPGLSGKDKSNLDKLGSVLGNVSGATREPDQSEEIRIGQEFAATLVGAKPLVADPRMQRYINVLGRWIAMQTERPDLPWTFGVLDDNGFNAFATPGGHVFVTRGLLGRMRNEAELAGVLAHEIGHVLRKHHLRAVQKNARAGLLADLGGSLVKGGNQQAREALAGLGRKLYASGLDQGDEFEADRLGVVIAARAGFDPYGLPSVLQMLQSQSAQDGAFSLQFRTHPQPGERIAALDRLMGDRFDQLPSSQGKPLAVRLAEAGK